MIQTPTNTTTEFHIGWLEQKYVVEELTLQAIADERGCSASAVWRAVKRFGLKRRLFVPHRGRPATWAAGGAEAASYRFPRETDAQSAMWRELLSRSHVAREVA